MLRFGIQKARAIVEMGAAHYCPQLKPRNEKLRKLKLLGKKRILTPAQGRGSKLALSARPSKPKGRRRPFQDPCLDTRGTHTHTPCPQIPTRIIRYSCLQGHVFDMYGKKKGSWDAAMCL